MNQTIKQETIDILNAELRKARERHASLTLDHVQQAVEVCVHSGKMLIAAQEMENSYQAVREAAIRTAVAAIRIIEEAW